MTRQTTETPNKGAKRAASIKSKTWGKCSYTVTNGDAPDTVIIVSGWEHWALECLIAAGDKGCSPIDHPGPRWSAYVFDLRGMGVDIETIHEPHAGDFPGNHARYILRSHVERVAMEGAA